MALSDTKPDTCRKCGKLTKVAHYITYKAKGLIIWQRVCVECKKHNN